MSRKYSPAFVQERIDMIDAMHERCQDVIVTPDCLMPEEHRSTTYGPPRLSKFEREQIKKYYKQLQELAYVKGFWAGWVLREGA